MASDLPDANKMKDSENQGELNEIWTEKYRPKKLDEVAGQSHIIPRLKAFLETKTLPHCLFAGSHGVGKTTTAMCIAQELYGSAWHSNFLELNASDERGIDTIRIKVKDFARTLSFSVPFKIVYLDEADSLTKDAQHALRRTMERYSRNTRFIFSANYSSKIIPPIQSRTAVFRFSSLKKDELLKQLEKISFSEKLSVNQEALGLLFDISEGDMRKAVNILQTASVLNPERISKESVLSVTSNADPEQVKNLVKSAMEGRHMDSRALLLDMLVSKGLGPEDVMKEVYSAIMQTDIGDEKKYQMLEKLGEYEFRIAEGSNARIQLEAMLASFSLIARKG